MTRYRAAAARTSVLLSFALFAIFVSAQAPPQPGGGRIVPDRLRARAEREGRVRVLVELKLASGRHVPEGQLRSTAAIAAQRREILGAGGRMASRLGTADRRIVYRYQTVPYVALEVSPAALAALEAASSDIVRVLEDEIVRPVLAQSVPLIQADQAWASGYDGTGTTVAVLDTGVDSAHPFLAGKVVDEACFSSTLSGRTRSTCPDGSDQQIGAGAATPCALDVCLHGTHVAGIAAGNGGPAGQTFSGVGKGAHLVAVQVFSEVIDPASCGGTAPCAGALSSDIIAGLEYVYNTAASLNIVAVNMSLGGSSFSAPCDTQPYKPAIDNLRSINVATVVAAGNDGSGNTISSPGCISSAISVGSVDKNNDVSYFSNVASFLSIFAPGGSITSSVPGGTYRSLSGTSMATPHVAGTWAILREAVPAAGVSLILDTLRRTGLPITDNRPTGTGVTVPRVSVFEALGTLLPVTNPSPTLTTVAPARLRATTSPVTLTLTGSDFNAFSVAYVNGLARSTIVVSATQLQVRTAGGDLTNPGTAQISVSTPAPGGGTSASLTVTIDPPPTLAVSATTVPPSARVTVTLANGFGGAADWLSLTTPGSSNTSYISFTYVGTGVTDRTWTVTMPSTAGTYEFRLLTNTNSTLAATSPPVTVDASVNPVPTVSSLSPSSTPAGGPAFTLTVNGTGFIASSVVRWNGSDRPTSFINSTQLQAAIAAADVAAVGADSVTVASPAPGGGTSQTVTFSAVVPPSLTVSATTAQPGGSVTATLTNGSGGYTDWLALASTTAPNTSYITYIYVGGGVTTRTWTVSMPTTPGTYEFRYFPNGGYTRAATSPAVTVQSGAPSAPVVTSLSPASVVAGSGALTLTVNGSGFTSSSIVRWNGSDRATTFVSAAQLRASIAAADVAAPGTAAVTVFAPPPGGGTSSAVSFTISAAASSPAALTVSSTAVTAGASVTVTLTNGAGGSGDWLAFALTSAPNTGYTQFTYVGTGVTTRTWTVTAPAAGVYEFRLFPNNGYTRAATSPSITVTASQSATLTVSATTVAPGASVTVTLNGGAGGQWDWLALEAASASNASYITYTYVGNGVTTRTWTVTMPSTPGTYEFRLFLNNGYTRAATSPPVTVQ